MRATFRGTLVGGPGQEDTRVTIYAVDRGGGRVPVEVLTADRRGRFRFAYRFSRTRGPTTYRFIALLRAQTGYPYAAARSAIVPVRVG